MGLYSKYVLPHLLNVVMAQKHITQQRTKVVPLATGRVLEIGLGTGHNLAYYDVAKVTKVYGLEPAAEMRAIAGPAIEAAGIDVELLASPAEDIPLDDDSVDTVLTTYTLCTVGDAPTALSAMRRVLKPGGRLIFCEHGKAPDRAVQKWQNRINPLWKPIGGGCNINRDIPKILEDVGFRIDALETGYLPDAPRILSFNYWGNARVR